MIKTNYKKFLLEKMTDDSLEYYMFDWDDNVLIMPTIIHVEHRINGEWIPTDLSTAQFAEVRADIAKNSKGEDTDWKLRNGNYTDTYCEFRDYGPRGDSAFVEDMMKSVKTNSFGPVWDRFLQCMIDGHVFMIITARGHEPSTIRFAINWIIYNVLNTKEKEEMEVNLREFNVLFGWDDKTWTFKDLVNHYLDMCDFVGIYSKYFTKKYNTEGQAANPEKYKALAIRSFTEKIHEFGKKVNRKVKVGFSDDDTSTAEHVHKFMRDELSLDFPIDFHVYHTKDGIRKL